MTILTVILTHLEAGLVERQLAYLQALAPGSRFVICHGGRHEDFLALPEGAGVFIEDPSLRGPHFDKSINDTLRAVYDTYVRDDPAVDLVYLIEYDHLILRADFESSLRALTQRSDAGLFAKAAGPRNDTNWSHFLSVRGDERLDGYITGISGRADVSPRWGCLGTGMLMRRDALAAFVSLVDPPAYYVEMFLPTAIYHLGFDVVDVDAVSDLYAAVRWVPAFDLDGARTAKRAGRTFVHPFKALDQLEAIDQVLGSGENSRIAARSG